MMTSTGRYEQLVNRLQVVYMVASTWQEFQLENRNHFVTPWSTVLSEKLADPGLVKNLPAHYGTQKFIIAFTRARHLSLS
jgi:hypothetical protein